jgi:hypothetical protein
MAEPRAEVRYEFTPQGVDDILTEHNCNIVKLKNHIHDLIKKHAKEYDIHASKEHYHEIPLKITITARDKHTTKEDIEACIARELSSQ